MKRIVLKAWDEVNGQLVASYFRVYRNDLGEMTTMQVCHFKSPIMRRNEADCKGMMTRMGESQWFGKYMLQTMLSVFRMKDHTVKFVS